MGTNLSNEEYFEAAMSTIPPKLHVFETFSLSQLHVALSSVSRSADILNGIKKALVYGRELPEDSPLREVDDLMAVPLELNGLPEEVLHGIVGKITEAGELADLLLDTFGGATFDVANLKEELGDDFWYTVRICARMGWTFADCYTPNAAKLAIRHKQNGGNFNPDAATEAGRDREAEQAAMAAATEQADPAALQASDFPRRANLNTMTVVEKAIRDAMLKVEGMGADPRLTDAVMLLQAAQTSVADFIDNLGRQASPLNQARLGCATTGEMLEELAARASTGGYADLPVHFEAVVPDMSEVINRLVEVARMNGHEAYRTIDS